MARRHATHPSDTDHGRYDPTKDPNSDYYIDRGDTSDTGHQVHQNAEQTADQQEAGERGRRASEDIRRNHSAETAGRAMAARIHRVHARRRTGDVGDKPLLHTAAGPDTNPLTHRIATTPRPAASGSTLGRALAPIRRVLLKLMWPFALQQRAVNEELLATTKEADQNLRAVINQLEKR